MKYEYRSEHAEDIAQAYHRVCHAEREFLENIHPQHRATDIAKTTAEEPPVDEKMTEEPPSALPPVQSVPTWLLKMHQPDVGS